MPELNKLQQQEAQIEAARKEHEQKRAERQAWLAQVEQRREHFAKTGEIPAPPTSLNDVFAASLQQIKAHDRETLRNVAKSPTAFTGQGMPRPPHVMAAIKKQYFEAHNAEQG